MDDAEQQPAQAEQPDQQPDQVQEQEPVAEAPPAEANGEDMEGNEAAPEEGAAEGQEGEPEEQEEKEMDYSQDKRVTWMTQNVTDLDEFQMSTLTNEKLQRFYDFLETPDYVKFFVWLNDDNDIETSYDHAPAFFGTNIIAEQYQVAFFIKGCGKEPIQMGLIDEQVITGKINSNPLDDLLTKMTSDFVPQVQSEQDWPDGVKKTFQADLNKFMATLTEESANMKGKTQLYIPDEHITDPDAAKNDKELVQRLESTVIYWTRQIKEVVSNQETQTTSENQSPLDEIEHWRSRTNNLKALRTRLQDKQLKLIIKVLQASSSSYLSQFQELENKINEGFDEANDNLQCLSILQGPCKAIEAAQPKEIPKLLPEVLNNVRMIWEVSKHYCTTDKLKSLLTKISNQIIQRCKVKINKEDMYGTNVEKCIGDLNECIDCCDKFREISSKMMCMIMKFSFKRHEMLANNNDLRKEDTIFAEIEAFIQRCRDLKEICEGQLQFALAQLPIFGGSKGKEWKTNLLDLKEMFQKHLKLIKDLTYDILDVKITQWHEDYGQQFKEEVKNLENIYTTIVQQTFKHVSTIEEAVEMLENFYKLAKRPAIIEFVNKKATDLVYKLFMDEIKSIDDLFEQCQSNKLTPPMPFSHPNQAGVAIWSYSLLMRAQRAKLAIDGLYFIRDHPSAKDAIDKFDKLKLQIDDRISKNMWDTWQTKTAAHATNERIEQYLACNLLIRHTDRAATRQFDQTKDERTKTLLEKQNKESLESNFDTDLLKLLFETQYWNKIQTLGMISFPLPLTKLLTKKEQLRMLRENVMLIVHDYNGIMQIIDDKEKELFNDQLTQLDAFIRPGITKYNWNAQADIFVNQCRANCLDNNKKINEFKSRITKVQDQFETISSTILTKIKKGTLYELSKFMSAQESEFKTKSETFRELFQVIRTELFEVYKDLFLSCKQRIQNTWLEFLKKHDDNLKKALRSAVKNTLLDFQKHVHGDSQEIVPLFKCYTVLEKDKNEPKVLTNPTHATFMNTIADFIRQIIQVTSGVPRLEQVFRDDRQKVVDELKHQELTGNNSNNNNMTDEEKIEAVNKKYAFPAGKSSKLDVPYVDSITQHKEINSLSMYINDQVLQIKERLDDNCRFWEISSELRYVIGTRTERGKQRLFKQDQQKYQDNPVLRYKQVVEELSENLLDIRNQLPQKSEKFISVEFGQLKQTLLDMGQDYQTYIMDHLKKDAKNDLNSLIDEMRETVQELKKPATKLETLKKNKMRYQEVRNKQDQLQARLVPIRQKFAYITDDSNDSNVTELTEDEKQKLASLDEEWNKFQKGLTDANQIIQKNYQEHKLEMDNTLDDYKKEVLENKANFKQSAPFSVEKGMETENEKALLRLEEFKNACLELKQKEEDMKPGLEIFQYDAQNYPELKEVEFQNQLLTEVWELKNDFDNYWNEQKVIQFRQVKFNEVEQEIMDYYSKLENMGRTNKEIKAWPVYEFLKQKWTLYRIVIPIALSLTEECIRPRHWNDIRFEVKEEFNEDSDEFNLERVFELKLDKHEVFIDELTTAARAQLKIEKSLIDIKNMWEDDPNTDLDITRERSRNSAEDFHRLNSTETIFQLVEEHLSALANHKSSPFYKQFQEKIDFWDNNISQMTETIELLNQVQSKWSYLESIFKGQPDLAKQLSQEASKFDQVDKEFRRQMARMFKEKNAYRSLIVNEKDFLKNLGQQNAHLDHIQKALKSFLDSKRGNFPRFYFLSDEDLLEIIGQGKDPTPINKHIHKIFEGIHAIKTDNPNAKGADKIYMIKKILSYDEECIDLDGNDAVKTNGNVEAWLGQLIKSMNSALAKIFQKFYNQQASQSSKRAQDKEQRSKEINSELGQVLVTMCQIEWTKQVREALKEMSEKQSEGGNNAMRRVKKMWQQKCGVLVECVEKQNLSRRDREKIMVLIIIEDHNRQVIENIAANKACNNPQHFDWQSQLKFEKSEAIDTQSDAMAIDVKQLNARFQYGYEYQGNNGRLVITALTDRAYMTLTNALSLNRGGAPQGPAGTGKTETVKDLGKALALYVVITNCSDQMGVEDLGKIFIGLSQAGAWGCFDEFNRILLDVLSVITSQIQAIMDALKKGDKEQCQILDKIILVKKETGLFITMNPGYAGRSELPDNLAALFRPVAMMAPDFTAIIKTTLMSKGFKQNQALSVKINTIYELMSKQLSKQSHYDCSMRAIKSVLNASGDIKRREVELDETSVVIKAIRDMNLPKFIAEDVVLFDNMFMDLFPDCEEPPVNTDVLQLGIEDTLTKQGLQLNENIVVKVMQLMGSKDTRHGNMLVGKTQSGKTTVWKCLAESMNLLNKEWQEQNKNKNESECPYKKVEYDVVNPKALNVDEFFGYYDMSQKPKVWLEGVCSKLLKDMCSMPQNINRWLVLDGPIDTLWIESMNSVLDDNKLLTLNNGDRIALSPNVRLLFEVQDLDVASPATVSRAGMIYMDVDELGYQPYLEQWIKSKGKQKEEEHGKAKGEEFGKQKAEEYMQYLKDWVAKYMTKVITIKRTYCNEKVKTSEIACVKHFCNLFDVLVSDFKKKEDQAMSDFMFYIEKWFVFCIIWSIGGTVDAESRREIDNVLRDIEPMFPHSDTVFEHHINPEKTDWESWTNKIPPGFNAKGKEFHEIIVPTIDTVRYRYLISNILNTNVGVLVLGESGVGKTVIVDQILNTLDANKIAFTINFSAGTTSNGVQDIIEAQFDRRAKNRFQPKGSKLKAICFVDDLNMPKKEEFGAQPPIELLRQWIDYGCWYDRLKIVKNHMCNLQLVAAMGPPGGGRAEITPRMLSCFHLINYVMPNESNLKKIFESLATFKFHNFQDEIKALCEPLAVGTIQLFQNIQEQFLPTPAHSHYVFNMRDISKVFQGLYMAKKQNQDTKEHMVKLWAHEVLRVFHDRLVSVEDQKRLKQILNEQLQAHFQCEYKDHCMTGDGDAVFVDFLQNEETKDDYEEVADFSILKSYLDSKLEAYNMQPKVQKMEIVLFRDAIIHITKIYRVLKLKRGHVLLVGVGGSGRHSLTRLSSYIADMNCEQLEIRRDFGLKDFRNKLKELYELSAFRGKWHLKTTFIFSDNDVVEETFLEDIQNTLNSGVVPNLFTSEELQRMREEGLIMKKYKEDKQTNESPDAVTEWFLNRVKDNLHLSICMSPVGETFRSFIRQYPALVNCTTLDWFMPWPQEALSEVAMRFLNKIDLPEDKKQNLANVCGYAHFTTHQAALMMQQKLRRVFYVTPTNFVELLKGFDKILNSKRSEIQAQINKLSSGLGRLEGAKEQVHEMTIESEKSRINVSKTQTEVQALLQEASKDKLVADEREKFIQQEQKKIEEETLIANEAAAAADRELEKAMPALNAANNAVASLDKKYIAEMKALNKPPRGVDTVMDAVMVFLEKPTGWTSVKKELNDTQFLNRIMDFNKDNIQAKTLKKIETYTQDAEFMPELMNKKSAAAGALCIWVRAIEDYAKCLKIVNPKREKKAQAEARVAKLNEDLRGYLEEFEVLQARLRELDRKVNEGQKKMDELKLSLAILQASIDRGEKLVSSLADEKGNWEDRLEDFKVQESSLLGDCIISAAFMSYCAPFPSDYRQDLNEKWTDKILEEQIKMSKGFKFVNFLASEVLARKWQTFGLPNDEFSVENGVFVTTGLRWALNIDPQMQCNKWLKNMHDDLVIADAKDADYLKKIEIGIQKGHTVLLQDVMESLDPTLDNVLQKALIQHGRRFSVKFGANEIDYHKNFRLMITTRLPNPHYTPEISTKVNVVNFIVVESGLEEQCLGIVVRSEQPQLEIQKNEKLNAIADGKAELIKLEDMILARLNDTKVNLLEDEVIIQQLSLSKETSDRVRSEMESAVVNMKRIDDTREGFRACGKRAAVLFFVLNDLAMINPMYQFSLDWYKELFQKSINESKEIQSQDRNDVIMKIHKLNVYNQACRSLFERHKLLLALQMFVKLQLAEGKINAREYDFFLRGGTVMDTKSRPPKPPQDWLTEQAWDHITELEKLLPETFAGISAAVTLNFKEWQHWFQSDKPMPEDAQLPGEWETKCDEPLKKMIVLRCFRPDRVIFAIKNFVAIGMKSSEFITTKSATMNEVYEESQPTLPVIFVQSPGTDPTDLLMRLADERSAQVSTLSLGKGQGEECKKILSKCSESGNWCFLSNCHLSIALLPELESIMDQLFKKKQKSTFRLFMSASPHDEFPISLLQRSLKIAQEPPRGIRAGMQRLYANQPKMFTPCQDDRGFRKAVFGLSWFHTILIERKKFKTLGWNVGYSFNDSDFRVCEDSVANYMGKILDTPNTDFVKGRVPWQALQYLIAECNYGGRVTDDRDRRLIKTYAKEIFEDNLIAPERWRPQGTEEFNYIYPADEANTKHPDLASIFNPEYFTQEIYKHFEAEDKPQAFGQHTNAEITSQITDTDELLLSILSLMPAVASGEGGESANSRALKIIQSIQSAIPTSVDVQALKVKHAKNDDNPLTVVLIQEITRYNILLDKMRSSCAQLEKGIQGLVVISPDLEAMLNALMKGVVPQIWSFAYFSVKNLGNWVNDLKARYEFFALWAAKTQPYVTILSYFTYPTGFTTSLLQKFSRKAGSPSIDRLEFDYIPSQKAVSDITEHVKDGACISGLFIEGGKWNSEKQCLCEPEVMELTCPMPVIHFKPIPKRQKPPQGIYVCPCYYYPIRQGGIGRDSFMFNVDLKTGELASEFWVKRGTALLMSTAN